MPPQHGSQRPGESRVVVVGNTNPSGDGMNGNCYFSEGLNPTLTCNKNEGNRVAIPVLTPERANKRQNGRRFKEDGEEAFTLTSQDRHGVAVGVDDLYAKREPRFYDEEIPTIRSDRTGLKVAVEVKPVQMSGYKVSEQSDDVAKCLNCTDSQKVFGANQSHTMVGYNSTLKSGGGYDSDSTCSECEGLQGSVREQSNDDGCNDVFAIDKGIRPEEREVANCIESREDRGISRRCQEGTLICHKVT